MFDNDLMFDGKVPLPRPEAEHVQDPEPHLETSPGSCGHRSIFSFKQAAPQTEKAGFAPAPTP
jgi:hypothetical protein